MQPPMAGISARDLTQEERVALDGNKGVAVRAVVKGSPAYNADILRGDIIVSFAGTAVRQPDDLTSAVSRHAGTEVEIVILRKGRGEAGQSTHIEKTVRAKLNQRNDTGW
jgi:S1-C subfamily serine protease